MANVNKESDLQLNKNNQLIEESQEIYGQQHKKKISFTNYSKNLLKKGIDIV